MANPPPPVRPDDRREPLLDARQLADYVDCAEACWVQDIVANRVTWANQEAVRVLHSPSMEELLSRDVRPLSQTAKTRLEMFQRRVSVGRVLHIQWTTYALGRPVTFLSEVRGFSGDDGRVRLFFRARDVSEHFCAESLRSLAASRHSIASYFLFALDGTLLEQNAASIREFGELEVVMSRSADQFVEMFVDAATAVAIRRDLQAMEVSRVRARLRTLKGERWYAVVTQPILDPVDGARVLHVECFDISDLVAAESKALDAQRLMQRVADEFAHPVTYVDAHGKFRFVNRAYRKWLNRDLPDLVGRRVDEIEQSDLVERWKEHWPALSRGDRVNFELHRSLGEHGDRWFSIDAIPFHNADTATVDGAIVFGYDVHALRLAEAGLAASQREMAKIADSLPVAVCKSDRDGRILFANRLFCEWFGLRVDQVVGKHISDAVGTDAYVAANHLRARALAGETVSWRRYSNRMGRDTWIDVTLAPAVNADGEVDALISVYADVTARVLARQELTQTRSTLSSHFANTPLAVIELDKERRVKEWTGRASSIFAWSRDDVLGQTLEDLKLFDEESRSRFGMELNWLDHSKAERFTLQLRNLRRDGGAIHAEWYGSVLRNAQSEVSGYLMLVQDISAKVAAEHHLQYVANHDLLTGLANRSQFQERLQAEIARAKRLDTKLMVALVDLDRFKMVNDSLGHQAGDALLQMVASRLRGALRDGDLLARSGGDEFMVLIDLDGVSDTGVDVIDRLRDTMAQPFQLLGQDVFVSASIGASIFPQDAETGADLIKHADWSMFRAKDAGRNSVQFYADTLANDSSAVLSLESDLRRAIDAKQLELHFQAKIDITNSRLTGAEALLRWRHPQRGLVPPESFIPLAEEAGMIVDIGAWVISEACRQIADWRERFGITVQVAVNLSAVQLKRTGLPDGILAELQQHRLPGGALMVEITETSVVTDPILASESLQALRAQGVHAAIDDFGKGFSSLTQLKRLPIDALKIDGSFVRDLVVDRDDAAIVNAIIGLAHNLDLKVIAEGVETQDQLAFLKKSGCDEAQGYLIARPVPAAEFERAFLRAARTSASAES